MCVPTWVFPWSFPAEKPPGASGKMQYFFLHHSNRLGNDELCKAYVVGTHLAFEHCKPSSPFVNFQSSSRIGPAQGSNNVAATSGQRRTSWKPKRWWASQRRICGQRVGMWGLLKDVESAEGPHSTVVTALQEIYHRCLTTSSHWLQGRGVEIVLITDRKRRDFDYTLLLPFSSCVCTSNTSVFYVTF